MTEETKERLKFWLKAIGIVGALGGWALLGSYLFNMAKKETEIRKAEEEASKNWPFLEQKTPGK